VTAPNEQARTVVPATAGRLLADGRRVYRLVTSLAMWWTWVGLATLGLGDLLIQGHDYVSLKFALGLLTVTGLIFACTFWPKVIADDSGLVVRNPLRSFAIPWGAVKGIFLADSVEIQCARGPGKKDKTVYSWALSSARRGRARSRLHGWQWEQGKRHRPSSYGQLPSQAKELVKMSPAEVIAREMAKMSQEARARLGLDANPADGTASLPARGIGAASPNGSGPGAAGRDPGADGGPGSAVAPGDVVTSGWAWPALAAILVPAMAFAISVLVG